MPKSYTEKERASIILELRNAAMASMLQKGIKKTTVDELVKKVRIPKGTFYLFYKSKELLFYDALMQKEQELHSFMEPKLLSLQENLTAEALTDLLYEFYKKGFESGIMPLMLNGELEVLIRKLPDDIVADSISKDDDFLAIFTLLFPNMKNDKVQLYSAAFRAIFFTAAYKREIGYDYDNVLKLLIQGVVLQIWENHCDRS